MAFANKISNLFKQAITSNPSLSQAVRYMSSSKVFVGGVSYGTDDHGLREAFSQHGEVLEARIIKDRETGRSRGFGFVTFESSDNASAAIAAMDGKELHGRIVRVNYATDRTGGFRSGSYGGGNYGGGGGYGGGNYGGGGGGSYGGGGGYGGGNYGGSGYSNNYGGSSGNYGAGDGFGGNTGNYPADNYSSGGGNYSAAGGDDGFPGVSSNNAAGYSSSGAVGYDNTGNEYSNNLDSGSNGGSPEDDLGNFKDDDEPDDFTKRA